MFVTRGCMRAQYPLLMARCSLDYLCTGTGNLIRVCFANIFMTPHSSKPSESHALSRVRRHAPTWEHGLYPLKLDNTFLKGAGSKVFAEKAPSNGETHLRHTQLWSSGNAPSCRILGRRFESWSVDARVRTAPQKVCGRLHYHSATAYAEISRSPHCLDPCLPPTKNPKCVFLSD